MAPTRRSRRRQDWPRGLYEPRPGYYVWRHPDGRTFALGSIPLAHARHEAIQANAHVTQQQPTLVEKLTGGSNTVSDLLDKMETAKAANTQKSDRSRDKAIREFVLGSDRGGTTKLGDKACSDLTVADCADVVESLREAGKARWAESVRSRLIAVCTRGMQLGWMDSNPAAVTRRPDVVVHRQRLTLAQFQAVLERAAEVAEWLPTAMMLALVTGQDRSTVVAMERSHISEGYMTTWRSKTRGTNQPVAIPLDIRLDAIGLSLRQVLATRSPVLSRYLVHHAKPWGNAPRGSAVHPDTISHAFTEARKLAGIPDENAPTFHEIRSLAKRLYTEQGDVDTKALLGHSTEKMSDLYANPRGAEAIKVRIG